MRATRRIAEHMAEFGRRQTAEAAIAKLVDGVARRAARKRMRPSLNELFFAADAVFLDAANAAAHIAGAPAVVEPEAVADEYAVLQEGLHAAYARGELRYPDDWSVGEGSAFLLYSLIRCLRPSVVLETGVANGHSTFLMLGALARNGRGTLTSVDIDRSAGGLLLGSDTSQWDFRVLPGRSRSRGFRETVASLGKIDLFVHDSDHEYRWQRLELDAARPRMSPRGVIACDDVDASYAYLDFCADLGLRPTLLVERRKVFGVVRTEA